MSDLRLTMAAHCLRTLNELVEAEELASVSFGLADPETIVVTVELSSVDEIVIELYLESSDNPLDAAVTVFDHVQDHLAENGPTRAQARPRCRPGHSHPALCERRGDSVVLACGTDLTVIRQLI